MTDRDVRSWISTGKLRPGGSQSGSRSW